MKNIFLVIFLFRTIGWISCGDRDREESQSQSLEDTDLMMTLSVNLNLEQLSLGLTPTQKQILKLKSEKFKTIKFPTCSYYNMGKNFTQYAVNVYTCKDAFGFPDDLDKLPPNEYAEDACDLDTWNEVMECVLPPTQDLIFTIARCSSVGSGKDWSIDSGIYQRTQYLLVSGIPTVLDSFRKFICANPRILTMQLEMQTNKKALGIVKAQKYANNMEALALVLCLLIKNPKLLEKEKSICDRAASIDLSTISECFSENEVYGDPNSHDIYEKSAKLFQFTFEKNNGPEKIAFLKTLWEEFCSEESPLSKIFNDRSVKKAKPERKTTAIKILANDYEMLRATSLV